MSRPFILLTNDDGFDAPGLQCWAEALSSIGRLLIAAPDREQSGMAHALTLERPLRVTEVAEDRYRIDGTPTDCVHLAVDRLCGGQLPDLVCSGINRGLNVGDDITYSGTVAGALEGALLHIPSMALSTAITPEGPTTYERAAKIGTSIAQRILNDGIPGDGFLNVNVPAGELKGTRITRQGTREYRATAVERRDPNGRPYFWIDTIDMTPTGEADGDHQAIAENYVSITPLHPNLTHEAAMTKLAAWTEVEIDA